MDYVEQFAEENPRIPVNFITRKVLYKQDLCAENKTKLFEEEEEVSQGSQEEEVKSQDGSLDDENADVDDDDNGEEEDEQESETEEDFEIRKEAAIEQASVAHAKKLYEDLLKSRGKKWADRMKKDLKDIARSKIEAELKKRYSVTTKTISKTKK
jgi:hypothetical protein